MAMNYRIYMMGGDEGGWHSSTFSDSELANEYFKQRRAEFPDAFFCTEVVDDVTSVVHKRKFFGNGNGLNIRDIKATMQEYVNVYKYDIKWNETSIDPVMRNASAEEVSSMMVDAAKFEDGFGTEWIYVIKPCSLCDIVFVD